MASFRKFKADNIFTGTEMLDGDNVLIVNEKGTVEAICPIPEAGEEIELIKGILSPGFINCHCHLELSIFKNKIPRQTGLADFIKNDFKLRPLLASEENQTAMVQAAGDLYTSGTMAVGDICNTSLSLPAKMNSPLQWKNFVEVSGFIPSVAEERLDEATSIRRAFKDQLLHSQVVPHAPYSVSEKLFRLINEDSRGKLISIHNQEAAAENEFFLSGTGDFTSLYKTLGLNIEDFTVPGKRSIAWWLPFFDQGQSIISVHNSFTKGEDLAFAVAYAKEKLAAIYYCLCPRANLYIDNCVPPVPLLRACKQDIVLGTDSYASNDSLDIWGEILQLQQSFPEIPLGEMLGWATLNGAIALGLQESLGSFEAGKIPGVLQIHKNKVTRIL
ncbi:MAG: amidohydrolase family protein [Ferruginibacter sp.]